MKFKLLTAIILLIFSYGINAQLLSKVSKSNYLRMRYGNILKENSELTLYSATRFLSIISAHKLSNWRSPNSVISINNIPFNSFPLNFKTLDLLPLDMLQTDRITTNNCLFPTNENGINFITKPINNSFEIRGFLGSETGDPLIYTFTHSARKETSGFAPGRAGNKNKIAPSGVLSYSNKNGKLNYRLTAGYFGFYSTGSGNDETIRNLNPYFYQKQNKQIYGSAELEYPFAHDSKLSFYSSIISYYGWDVPPFIGTFSHFETYLHTVRLKAVNIFNGFSVSFVKDGSITKVNETAAFLTAKFSLSEFKFIPTWQYEFSEKYEMNIYSKITLETADDRSGDIGSIHQQFFDKEYKKWDFLIGIKNKYYFTDSFVGHFNLEFQNHFIKNSVSGKIGLLKYIGNDLKILFDFSSNIRFANLTELYGNFTFDSSYMHKNFGIKANGNIEPERTNLIELGIEKNFVKSNLSFSANIYFEEIQKPIRQETFSSERLNSFADIFRNANYINENNKNAFGGNLNLSFEPADFLKLSASINYIENDEVKYVPKNKIFVRSEFILPFKGIFALEYQHKSRSYFEEYKVKPIDDYYLNKGFDGLIPETNIFNLSYQQKLMDFYFAEELIFDISIRNIFDRINKYHPIGNNLGRTIVISVYSNI